MTVRKVRQSEIKAFRLCKRNWQWNYAKGYVRPSETPSAADVGTLVHGGLQALYEGNSDPVGWVRDQRPEAMTKEWEKTYTLAEVMVDGYADWLAETGSDADYRVLSVERQIEVSFGEILGDEVIVTGRLDLVVEHEPTGLIYLRDHKSVQSLDQAGRQLQIDDQLLTYALLLRMSDPPVRIAGAEHNMLKRVQRTARAEPPFYGRAQATFNDEQLRNHWTHMRSTLTEIVAAYQALEADPASHQSVCPPNPTKDCTWRCHVPGIDLCIMLDDGSDAEGFVAEVLQQREAA